MIRSAEQHQEERPISLVFGRGSAVLRTLHNDLPFGRANAPPPYATALFQEQFKNRKLVRHCDLISQAGYVRRFNVYSKSDKISKHRMIY